MYKKMVLFVLLLSAGALNAKNDVSGPAPMVVTSSSTNASIEAMGIRYNPPVPPPFASRTYYTERAYGLIKLSCPGLYAIAPPATPASVTVNITYDIEESGTYVSHSVTQTLTLQADLAKAIDAAYYKAEGAEHIKAKITSVHIPAGWPTIQLEASVYTESFDYLNFNAILGSHLSTVGITTAGNLKVKWNALKGAEVYDLEWTYVSNKGPSADTSDVYLPGQIEVDRFLFRTNSSRIELTDTTYEIPLMYEKGYILYRLRASGKRLADGVVTKTFTEWTAPDGIYGTVGEYPSANVYLHYGLEKNINWQSSLTFAEEGKHKAVLAYHDGSMRNRQAVTRINTDQRAVVGETFYDYNGKPVIQVLPVPVTQNALTYYPNFNLIQGETQLQKQDYSIMGSGAGCAVKSPDMSIDSGASRYYSPQNNFVGSATNNTGNQMINRDNVPDAHQKPYTQTKYTPDNTGKIAAQSGVGNAHQLGTGHETKYFYGTPQQEELTRLFGNQVGYYVHYKKDLTVDPNGQVSVTYKNLGDKVVATTIVGNAPTNLTELEGDKTKDVKTDLLGVSGSANPLSKDGLSKNFLSKFTVPADNDYTFDYSAILGSYNLSCINATGTTNVALDGAVDLTIQLIDGCGSVVFVNPPTNVPVLSTNAGHTGTNQTLSVKKEDVNLKQGEYVLSKQLSINENKLEQYWQEYLGNPNNCLKDTNDFVSEETAKIDLLGCDLTCAKCEAEIYKMLHNTSANYSDEERASIATLCDDICDKEVGCTTYLNAMLGDMSPGGQYAELRKPKLNSTPQPEPKFDSNNNPVIEQPDITFNKKDGAFDAGDPADDAVDTTSFPLSIFNYSNSLPLKWTNKLPVTVASWRTPLQISKAGFTADNRKNQILSANISLDSANYTVTDYKDVNGDTVYAYIYRVSGSTFKPSIIDTTQKIMVDELTQLYKIPIRFLSNVADFEKYWQPHFANYLIPYHPEYGYLIDCSQNYRASNDFDYSVTNTDTYSDAVGKGYISSPGNQPYIIRSPRADSRDPFVQATSGNYKYMNLRNNEYKQGKSMAKIATAMANCPRGDQGTDCQIPPANCDDGIIDTDTEWIVYKGLYLSEKQKFLKQIVYKKAVDNYYYNGCIGDPDFYTSPEAYYFRNKRSVVSTTVTERECHTIWGGFYDFFWGCPYVTRHYSSVMPAYLDPRQVSYQGRADLFRNKTKRFFVNVSSNSSTGQMPLQCENTYEDNESVDGSTDTIIVPTPCDSAIINTLNETSMEAQRYKFESCGLCPFASEVEAFIMDLHDNKSLESDPKTHVSCVNDDVQLGEQMYRQLSNLNAGNSDISWKSTVTTTAGNGKVLEGKFVSGTTDIATLRLTIPANTVPAFVQFDSLIQLCCMTVTKGIIGPNAGKLFTFHAVYDSLKKAKVPFTVYGYFDLKVDTCNLTPRCMATDDSRRVTGLLNMLAITGMGKSNELLTNGQDVDLLSGPDTRNDYYLNAIRSLIKKDNDLVYNGYISDDALIANQTIWNDTLIGSVLTGAFTYIAGTDTTTIVIDLSGLSNGAYGNIKEFSRIRPYPGDSTKFYVDALISQGTKPSENGYVTITVEVPAMKTTVCEELKPPVKD